MSAPGTARRASAATLPALHAPKRRHGELEDNCRDMIHLWTATEVEDRRTASHLEGNGERSRLSAADSLDETEGRLSAFLSPSQPPGRWRPASRTSSNA